MFDLLVSVIRTLLLYSFVIFSVRLMGKRQMGEMQASEMVVTLLISNIAAIPMQSVDMPLLSGIVPIISLVLIELAMSYIMLKSSAVRHFISGRPVVVISNGKIDQEAMKKIRFSNEDLFEQLRKNSIFNLSDVEYAIIEPDGVLSVLVKAAAMPPNAENCGMKNVETSFYAMLISDGKIEEDSSVLVGWSRDEIENAVKASGCEMSRVFLMVGDKNKKYHIIRREKK